MDSAPRSQLIFPMNLIISLCGLERKFLIMYHQSKCHLKISCQKTPTSHPSTSRIPHRNTLLIVKGFCLAYIFNLSLHSGIFTKQLPLSRVIPIFKSGNQLECDNYKPISLLSAFSKIFLKILAKKLLTHLSENNLIYNHQYGFLPGRSTEQNLIHVTNYITTAFNDKMYCVGVFIDLGKAFDVCSH